MIKVNFYKFIGSQEIPISADTKELFSEARNLAVFNKIVVETNELNKNRDDSDLKIIVTPTANADHEYDILNMTDEEKDLFELEHV